jgi:hypothetical protein
MNSDRFDAFLDGALKRYANAPQGNDASVERVLTRLAAPLPPQKKRFWRLPAVLLDWQFAPAWPRMAALGACAVVGFAIGISGVDRHIDHLDNQALMTSSSGPGMFEPEPLIGDRP